MRRARWVTLELRGGGQVLDEAMGPQWFHANPTTDDRGKPTPPPPSKTPELCKTEPLAATDTHTKAPPLSLPSETPTPPSSSDTPLAADIVDAPLPAREPTPTPPPSAPEVPAYPAPLPNPGPKTHRKDTQSRAESKPESIQQKAMAMQEAHPKEDPAAATCLDTTSHAPTESSNGVAETEAEAALSVTLPSSPDPPEDPLDSPIVQPEELRLPNGLPLPAPRDPQAPAGTSQAERDRQPPSPSSQRPRPPVSCHA
ncbi:hypothetical protein CRUP_002506 [Coryphaenoides rupestris]|nr:hypothetical protein CRUP_002506 [Coryphaenoides rupestris]